MNKMKFYVKIFNFILFLCLVANIKYDVNAYSLKKNILILNSYHKGYSWSDSIIDGIKEVLVNESENYNIKVEYMDSKIVDVVNYRSHIKDLYNLYKNRYRDYKFDIIITSDNDSYLLMKQYGKDIFGDIPVISCGLNYVEGYKYEDYYTIEEKIEIENTLNTAIGLHKNIENIAVITDKTITGVIVEGNVRKLNQSYYEKQKFHYIKESDIGKCIEKLKTLPKNTIIFYQSVFKDVIGQPIPIEDSCKMITKETGFPIYSCWDSYVGNGGVLGGKAISSKDMGRMTAELAKEKLNADLIEGEETLEYDTSSSYIFDYNELKRFNIDMNDLPHSSIVKNLPYDGLIIPKQSMVMVVFLIMFALGINNIILFINIQYKRKIQNKLKQGKEQYERLVEFLPDSVFVLKESKICYANKSAQNLIYEDNLDNIIGKNIFNVLCFPKKMIAKVSKCLEKLMVEEGTLDFQQYELKMKNRKKRYVEYAAFSYILDDQMYIVLLIRDIQDKKIAQILKQNMLIKEKQLKEIQEYEQLKNQFFATISHELKTPLNIVLSSINLMQDVYMKKDTETSMKFLRKYIKICKLNSYRLLKIINNLIDITGLDAGFLNMTFSNHNIVKVVEDICQSVSEYVKKDDIEIVFDTDIEEKIIACDENMIERVMLNILSNSLKFNNNKSSIYISMYDKKNYVEIVVKDSGIGIPENKLETIFERFRQVDDLLTRKKEGSGIGLAIVKRIVSEHEGKVFAKSKLGVGSEFIIQLPINVKTGAEQTNLEVASTLNDNVEKINIEFSDIYELDLKI